MPAPVVRLSTSVRSAPLAVTRRHARRLARTLGITRVTDITRLDSVGVPVFASIRPDACPGSLCVNAGKGLRAGEASVGAYMEAIEFAYAEFNRAGLTVIDAPAAAVYEGKARPDSLLDFCPLLDTEIPLDAPMACVPAEDVATGELFLVPAELVFLPYPLDPDTPRYFGSSSNGLASGNSVLEASIHGLAEVIERDIWSFRTMDDRSVLVDPATFPASLGRIVASIRRAGLRLYVRNVPNDFRLPYFTATIVDEHRLDPIFVNGGHGCHPSREVALTRAITESLQSRLSFIHGGRDDLTDAYDRYDGWTAERRRAHAERLIALAARPDGMIRFDEVVADRVPASLNALWAALVGAVMRVHPTRVLRVTYTPPSMPLQVVRILVPGLEFFSVACARVGRRLGDHVGRLN